MKLIVAALLAFTLWTASGSADPLAPCRTKQRCYPSSRGQECFVTLICPPCAYRHPACK